ncbi:MAG: hypothetical protein WDN69_00665, partial [Aliidongia sp.]
RFVLLVWIVRRPDEVPAAALTHSDQPGRIGNLASCANIRLNYLYQSDQCFTLKAWWLSINGVRLIVDIMAIDGHAITGSESTQAVKDNTQRLYARIRIPRFRLGTKGE